MRRPVVTLVAAVAILLALCIPVLDLKLGFVGVRALPDRFESKQGFVAFEESFGAGTTDSTQIVVDGDVSSPSVQAAIRRLEARLRADDAFLPAGDNPVPGAPARQHRDAAQGRSRDESAYDAVRRIRASMSPSRSAESTARGSSVTGETAEGIDYFDLMEKWMPIVFVFVLGLSFILLMIAFRSIVVPVKAIIMNLLSVGAAYGLTGAGLRERHRQRAVRLPAGRRIEAWVPLFLFAVLFGLSMDYHVFLLSRIRETTTQTGDNTESVACGVALDRRG